MTLKAQMLSRVHGVDRNGVVWAFPKGSIGDMSLGQPKFPTHQIDSEYRFMVQCAPMMFSVIAETIPALGRLIVYLESIGVEGPIAHIQQLQADLNVAEKCALEGQRKILIKKN